ncbi:MAG: hypothetical protein IPK12_17075 [Gemmatimonadetes bacterium]|nr:hypothetical protein [Gemmatimonadota bacterium]
MTFFLTGGAVLISRSEIGKAIAHRIRSGPGGGGEDLDALRGEVADLRHELDGVRHELAEAQERIDFTERLLAQGRASEQLPGG